MSLQKLFTGLNGALGLYSTVKGVFDASKYNRERKKFLKRAYAEEDGWYRRNYYGDYFNNAASRAAFKRVENTLRRRAQEERARAVLVGATPEYMARGNEQRLRSMENVMTNLASGGDERRRAIDAQHRQNRMALMNNSQQNLSLDERMAASSAMSGFNILQNALLGAKWGRESE